MTLLTPSGEFDVVAIAAEAVTIQRKNNCSPLEALGFARTRAQSEKFMADHVREAAEAREKAAIALAARFDHDVAALEQARWRIEVGTRTTRKDDLARFDRAIALAEEHHRTQEAA